MITRAAVNLINDQEKQWNQKWICNQIETLSATNLMAITVNRAISEPVKTLKGISQFLEFSFPEDEDAKENSMTILCSACHYDPEPEIKTFTLNQ